MARCFLGLDWLERGKTDVALEHFRWIKQHGNPSVTEFAIGIAEFERLEGKPPARR